MSVILRYLSSYWTKTSLEKKSQSSISQTWTYLPRSVLNWARVSDLRTALKQIPRRLWSRVQASSSDISRSPRLYSIGFVCDSPDSLSYLCTDTGLRSGAKTLQGTCVSLAPGLMRPWICKLQMLVKKSIFSGPYCRKSCRVRIL